jgi:hypothetical protein
MTKHATTENHIMAKKTSIKQATKKVNKLQKDLDIVHKAMFEDHKQHEEVLSNLPQVARDRFIQSGAMRSMAQIALTDLTYSVMYFSLPKSSRKDDGGRKVARKVNKQLQKKLGLSATQFKKYLQHKIDTLLPLAKFLAKETMRNWKEYTTQSEQS